MDFRAWRQDYAFSRAKVAEMTGLPVVVIAQLEQGMCPNSAVAQRLRFKLYQYAEDPEILTWKWLEDDPGGLPNWWWWRFTWEEQDGIRICVLISAYTIDDAKGGYWRFLIRNRLFAPENVMISELGALPAIDPDLFQGDDRQERETIGPRSTQRQRLWWRFSWEEASFTRVYFQIAGTQLEDAHDRYQQWAKTRRLPDLKELSLIATRPLPDHLDLYPPQPVDALPYPRYPRYTEK